MTRLDVSPELQEICQFLQKYSPFAELPLSVVQSITSEIVITYHRANTRIELGERDERRLYIVRSGSVVVSDEKNRLLDKLDVGGYFGFPSLLANHNINNVVETIEDSLIYRLRVDAFEQLRQEHERFASFFEREHSKRLSIAIASRQNSIIFAQPIKNLMSEGLISINPQNSILDAAKLMAKKGISSLVVVDDDETKDQTGQLLGILTDRDLRNRVVAAELDVSKPVEQAMTINPVTIDSQAFVDQAILLMMQKNIHHLPVLEQGKPVAILTVSDLIQQQKSEPILLINSIFKAKNTNELIAASQNIKGLLQNLITADVKADVLGRLLTTVTDALTQRLIQLAQQTLGPEPVPFTWLAFGSQGRQDQSAKSDQDNALLLDDSAKPEHDEYFKAMADIVCDGLDACGYIYCPGGIMASNKKWRQPLQKWRVQFIEWLNERDPEALLHASIFFDIRAVYNSHNDELSLALKEVLSNEIHGDFFIGEMTRNALRTQPPLGFFKQLVLHRSGEHKHTFNMKHRGLMPINDIVRVHALANGVTQANTIERIKVLAENGDIRQEQASNLLDALEFIAHMRLVHQGQQMHEGQEVDNYIDPANLSKLLQHQLKDTFQVIQDEQKNLQVRYAHNLPT